MASVKLLMADLVVQNDHLLISLFDLLALSLVLKVVLIGLDEPLSLIIGVIGCRLIVPGHVKTPIRMLFRFFLVFPPLKVHF